MANKEPLSPSEQFLNLGRNVLLVDPQYQGYGLQGHHQAVAGYANKFLPLSSSEGLFVTPYPIPQVLLNYYGNLDIDVAGEGQIIVSPPTQDGRSLIARIEQETPVMERIAGRRNGVVVPYMMTQEVENFAQRQGLDVLSHASDVDEVADKLPFQRTLAQVSSEIEARTGYNIAIAFEVVTAGDRENVKAAYERMSEGGTKGVVIVKPKSASAMGVKRIRAHEGESELMQLIQDPDKFDPDDDLMIEELVVGNQSPSMQGTSDGESYNHLYFGKQYIILKDDGTFGYDASHVPFSQENDGVSSSDLTTVQDIHQTVGSHLLVPRNIAGIGGLDSVMDIDDTGRITSVKFTEMNLHFPGSTALYAAIQKLYPNGFDGIAYNTRVPYNTLKGIEDFMAANSRLLVKAKGQYGIFPINGNYPTGVDLVVFAESKEHVDRLLQAIQT